jgi:hypothetical protein
MLARRTGGGTGVWWLVALSDPDGNIIGLIDNSKGGMPGQPR